MGELAPFMAAYLTNPADTLWWVVHNCPLANDMAVSPCTMARTLLAMLRQPAPWGGQVLQLMRLLMGAACSRPSPTGRQSSIWAGVDAFLDDLYEDLDRRASSAATAAAAATGASAARLSH